MSTTSEAALATLKAVVAEVSQPPYCWDTFGLEGAENNLFYRTEGNKAEIIDFTEVTDDQLKQLSEACQKATFGMNQKDVLDETYRKAVKMDPDDFSILFSPATIMNIVQERLFPEANSDAVLDAQLYKLNVYGPGSFFKAHIDTPRSDAMVGSLVVVLPTKHEGGSLIFRHRGQESKVDTAKAVSDGRSCFVAFFSDVEHEVSEVTSGYRVTLTYNIFMDKKASYPPHASAEQTEALRSSLMAILADKAFLPEGGFLGFGLSHVYPINPLTTELQSLIPRLKAQILLSCPERNQVMCLLEKFPKVTNEVEYDILSYLCRKDFGGVLVYNCGDIHSLKYYEDDSICFPIAWMKPREVELNHFESPYIVYGNQGCLDFVYGEVCLVARIGGPGNRFLDS